jgi:hypothetical protein
MSYDFYDAATPLWIREQEVGKGSQLTFSPFTSCIAVVTRSGNTLIGAHLCKIGFNRLYLNAAQRAMTPTTFNPAIAKELRRQFPDDPDEVLIFGLINHWGGSGESASSIKPEYQGSEIPIAQGYNQLISSFRKLRDPEWVPKGQYKVSIADGAIVTEWIGEASTLAPAHLSNW